MVYEQSSTIYALATPDGIAGVSVIRISGAHAFAIAKAFTEGPLPDRKAVFRVIYDPVSRETLDHALLIAFQAPASFTGEDTVEFHLHGSLAVVDAVLSALSKQHHCRLAQPGEFTWRAFCNGKMDMPTTEGLADLLEAKSQRQRQLAQKSIDGHLSSVFENWRTRILNLYVAMETQIDFPEEDIDASHFESWANDTQQLLNEMEKSLETQKAAQWVRQGVRVVIVGATNVGKSSLLNYLAGRDVAIVTSVEGTTRDTIEVVIDIAGVQVTFVDTAGVRESNDPIENEGIRRTHQQIKAADLILFLADYSRPETRNTKLFHISDDSTVSLWRIINKIDTACVDSPYQSLQNNADHNISIRDNKGLDSLFLKLEAYVSEQLKPLTQDIVLTHSRQIDTVKEMRESLDGALKANLPELKSEHLRKAQLGCDRLLGRSDPDQALDQIFARFCIGK